MLLFLICQEIHFFISNLNILKTTLACIWFSPVLGGNGLFTSMCNPILTLFYGEKSSPARKKSSYEDKPFAAQTPQRKRITLTFSRFSPVLSGNRLYYSKCNFILTLFYGEKSSYEDKLSKSRSRDYSPLDNPPTGGFCPKLKLFSI